MKLVTCRWKDREYLGVVRDKRLYLPETDPAWDQHILTMLQLIDAGEEALRRLELAVNNASPQLWLDFSEAELLSPIPRPRQNVMCLGWNYVEHVEETKQTSEEVKLPRSPIVFTKAATSMNGPYSDIPVDLSVSDKMDWEVELAVVIGTGGRKIKKENALQHIFGYTVLNDVTARDRQKWHKQFFIGKSFTGACPMGPWIVTQDEIADPQALNLSSRVNGALKQSSNTRHQIFDIATVIETLSLGMQLEPGDIIATGTPSGVGYARTPPEYLMPGDVVECEVEGIGCIRNSIVAY